jgi:NADP-dependent 3-hydroxy acid dehydrogenase YdfG
MSRTAKPYRVFITGAGSGLGRALALHYAAAAETLAHVQKEGGTGLSLKLDVTSEADFAAARESVVAAWGGVDLLINNAGVAVAGDIGQTPMADWQWVLDINLLGVLRGCRAFLPVLKAQHSGHIVNIASFAGIANPPGMSAYNCAKAAVVALSETLLHEVVDDGIGVSVVCPAFFATNLMNSARVVDPATVGIVHKWMKKSGVTAEDVARQIAQAVRRNTFMVLTHKDTRVQAAIKRASPAAFFKLIQTTRRKALQRAKGRAR